MIDKNQPAYPTPHICNDGITIDYYPGLTIRQYYAAKAMQGIIAGVDRNMKYTFIADTAFKIADAMIEYENKENK